LEEPPHGTETHTAVCSHQVKVNSVTKKGYDQNDEVIFDGSQLFTPERQAKAEQVVPEQQRLPPVVRA
jgi:hypothetical protein